MPIDKQLDSVEHGLKRFESPLERIIFGARWLMAPFYLGLIGSLAVLMFKFIPGNLVLMVIFSGYENFVSKIDVASHKDRPDWMGTVDFSGLKLKLIASIVAISGIHLLKSFMSIDEMDKGNLMWLLVLHGTFVLSGVLLALMDYITEKSHH